MKTLTPRSAALAVLFLALAVALVFLNPLAEIAAQYNRESSLVAFGVYTSYRVINRLVSMVAETQIEASAVFASITFMPGKTLQSLLDTLQRFGDMMFPLMVVSGILGVAIEPLARLGALLAAAGLGLRLGGALFGLRAGGFGALASGLASLGFLMALVVPGAYATGHVLGEAITTPSWNRAVIAFDSFSAELANAEAGLIEGAASAAPPSGTEPEENGGGPGFFESVMGGIAAGAGAIGGTVGGIGNVGAEAWALVSRIPDFMSRAGELVTAAFEFLIAYLIKTLVFPLAIGFLAISLWRRVERAPEGPPLRARAHEDPGGL